MLFRNFFPEWEDDVVDSWLADDPVTAR